LPDFRVILYRACPDLESGDGVPAIVSMYLMHATPGTVYRTSAVARKK